tara:strand:+ start:4124 stop:4663 length:540 start_codon:yes stop_codon:yes gene_type:complete
MGLETVKEEIVRNARYQEETMLAEARQEAKNITDEAEKEAAAMKEKANAETKRIINTIKKQELASAELDNKKAVLEAKKQLIDAVFDDAEKKIGKLSNKESYMDKLLAKSKDDIDVANVYCSKKDANLVKGYNAEAVDMIGGLIAENGDKTVRVDYSFDTMLQNIKENELQSVNKILFG